MPGYSQAMYILYQWRDRAKTTVKKKNLHILKSLKLCDLANVRVWLQDCPLRVILTDCVCVCVLEVVVYTLISPTRQPGPHCQAPFQCAPSGGEQDPSPLGTLSAQATGHSTIHRHGV